MNHYSKIGEKVEHPSKILIPKHFPLLKKPNNSNFYREEDKISEYNEEYYKDQKNEQMQKNISGKKAPFNNHFKNLVPSMFPIHSNLTNSYLDSSLTTERNLIKGNYLNEQVTMQKKEDVSECLNMLSKNGGIYNKIIKKFDV